MPQDSILRVRFLTNNISPFQSQKPRFLPPPFSMKFSCRTSCFSSLNHVSSHVPRTSFSYTRVYVPFAHDIITKTNCRRVTNPPLTRYNELHYVKPDNVALLAGLGHNTPAFFISRIWVSKSLWTFSNYITS